VRRALNHPRASGVLLLLSTFLIYIPSLIIPGFFHPHVPRSQVCEQTHLCASWSTPWGIITSNFVWDGYLNNLFLQLVYAVVIFICCVALPKDLQKKVFQYSALSIWVSTLSVLSLFVVLSEILYLLGKINSHPLAYGYSVVGYAAAGTALAFSVICTLWELRKGQIRRVLGFLILFVTTLIPLVLLGVSAFFNISAGVNFPVHLGSFLLSILVSYNRLNAVEKADT